MIFYLLIIILKIIKKIKYNINGGGNNNRNENRRNIFEISSGRRNNRLFDMITNYFI